MQYQFPQIGVIHSQFIEKFGVPKQSLMIPSATAVLKMSPDPSFRVAFNHLEQFSHIWVVFVFHKHLNKGWRPTIRPPRLDAPRRVGVFASRSPHRPSPIGLSAVKLDKIDLDAPGGIELYLSGVDLLDQTPVIDIKPYLPFADKIEAATSGWAQNDDTKFNVTFSNQAIDALGDLKLQKTIMQMLECDPRPTSQRRSMQIDDTSQEGKMFGFRLQNLEIKWRIRNRSIYVDEILRL